MPLSPDASSVAVLLAEDGAGDLPKPSPELRDFLFFLAESATKLLLDDDDDFCTDTEGDEGVMKAHANNGNRERRRMLREDFILVVA